MATHFAYKVIDLPDTTSFASIGAPKTVTLETIDGHSKHLVNKADILKDTFDGEAVYLVNKVKVIAIKTDAAVPLD